MARLTTLALALVIAGCGGGGEDGIALEAYCAEWAGAVCDTAVRCGCITPDLAPGCPSVAEPRCPLAEGLPLRMQIESGALAYDSSSASSQIEHIRASSCAEDPLDCGTTELCWGRSAEGGPCGTSTGCAAPLVCIGGACAPETRLGIGERCTEGPECASGRCDPATETCRDTLADGSLCNAHTDCTSGYCDREKLAAGACSPRLPTGSSCTEPVMCMDGACPGGTCAAAACGLTMM